ncbi:MAG TPA: amidohydrolase family protein [Chitinophagaceae bacterium]|nr:amidohydrolase family protein [Chitinophagaceae bacterium]
MKKILLGFCCLGLGFLAKAQETVYPAPAQSQDIALVHGTIHTATGEVIEDGIINFSKGKITSVGKYAQPASGIKVIDCSGKQIYPGLIAPVTDLGLNEIGAVRATLDEEELGENNADIRSVIAYNTDSKVINTLRSNGILLANVVPQGGIISGSSSVVQLDAWNWEDAVYKMDGGIHFRMPNLARLPRRFGGGGDPVNAAMERIERVRQFFQQAKAYFEESKHEHTNIKFEAVKGLFNQTQTFYVHCELVKEMEVATSFAKEFNFRTVIVGGADSWMIADYLKQNNIAVILDEMHSLPITQDDDVNQPYKTPYLLQQAGVQYAISDQHAETRGRNLMFNAGNACAFGLTKEQALEAITANAAKILGIADKTGTLEAGKDANIVVSDGDILDITSSNVIYAFIQGRQINLDNKHKELYERYKYKYGLK